MRLPKLTGLIVYLVTGSIYASPREELVPCHISHYSQEVLCGSHEVYEDRKSQSGRRITLRFALIPAQIEPGDPDPLVILPGGPGQAAMDMGPLVRIAFNEVRQTRDIVLVDQRGMGSSHPLNCEIPEFSDADLAPQVSDARFRDVITECLSSLDADVKLYTQDIANQDLHEILVGLGYQKINIYGVSWGTRSAQLYGLQFPDHVRAMILDSNAPVANKIPLYAAEDAESALQKALNSCANDFACSKAYPDLTNHFNAALALFGDRGVAVKIADPTTDQLTEFTLEKSRFVNSLRNILYLTDLVRLLPLVIEQASQGDYRAMAAITSYMNERQGSSMSLGASLTIICSEELQRMTPEEIIQHTSAGFLNGAFLDIFRNACAVWPKAKIPDIYNSIEPSSIPTLILSGDADPVTPPRWGEKMSETFTNSLQFVATNTGHNVAPVKCTDKLMAAFLERASVADLDGSCLTGIKRPTFFIDPSGPAGSIESD